MDEEEKAKAEETAPEGGSYADQYGISDGETPAVGEQADESAEPVAEAVADPNEATEGGEAAPQGIDPARYSRILAALQAQGLDSDDAVEAHLAEQQAQQAAAGQLAAYQTELQARIHAGSLDVDTAEELYNAKEQLLTVQAQAQAAQATAKAAEARAQQQAAEAELAKLDPTLAQAVRQVGLAPDQIKALADNLTGSFAQGKEKAVAQYVAAKDGQKAKPVVRDGGVVGDGQGGSEAVDYKNYSMMELAEMDARRSGRK